MGQNEKILILAALFHDIGKFEQRCANVKVKHEELGAKLIDEYQDELLKILDDQSSSLMEVKSLILDHHNKNKSSELLDILKSADHLSASERVGFDKEDDWKDKWSHKHLSSLFSKVALNNKDGKHQRYYSHKLLSKKDYKILIPEFAEENDIKGGSHNYKHSDWEDFKEQLSSVLNFYEEDSDFESLINLLLILFEKYMWCIPDFTGSAQTDISLYNHLKDVAGIAHALHKSDKDDKKLNLIIGDLPGIQNYIFNVSNKNPAKVLRGRSIFVQILTRQFATILLNKLGLTDANLIMLAGGKFYILAQNSTDFAKRFEEANKTIENHLINNFNYQLSFSSAFETFDYPPLMDKDNKITFGDVIDKASYKLLLKRNQQFKNVLFDKENFDENKFVLPADYVPPNEEGNTNKVKDAVTGLPIRKGRETPLPNSDTNELVDNQVLNEIKIGAEAPASNVIIEFDNDYSTVEKVTKLKDYKPGNGNKKILLNPDLDDLLNKENLKKDILRNTQIIEVANYSTWDEKNNHVLDFGEMEKANNGAKFLTLIKGDVDNLGLIMSSGLVGNKVIDNDSKEVKDLTGISRTTTLSNHLKYFFSFTLNGFLRDWEEGKVNKTVEDNNTADQKVYTVFAGGDDLMLVCPQSSSLKLLNELNKTFNDFACDNPEVHISYSLTNFKHNTPIRIVADMAEENQNEIKKNLKANDLIEMLKDKDDVFNAEFDKAGVRLFESDVKNTAIIEILRDTKFLEDNVTNGLLTKGTIRNLLQFTWMMNNYWKDGDTNYLLWHPLLTYTINKNVKKNGKYQNREIAEFFNTVLKINKTDKEKRRELSLYPTICNTIYSLRK